MEKLLLGNWSPESDLRASIIAPPTYPRSSGSLHYPPHAQRLTYQPYTCLSGLLTLVGHGGVRVKGGQWSLKKANGTHRREVPNLSKLAESFLYRYARWYASHGRTGRKKICAVRLQRVAADFVWILFFVSLNLFYRTVAGI